MSTIAELVGKVSVIVDNAQLIALRKELLATEKVIKSLQNYTRKGLNLKLGFDSGQVSKALDGIEKKKLFFSNLDISQQGRKDFQERVQSKIENTPIRFKNIVLSRQALKDFKKNLAEMFTPEDATSGLKGMELPLHFNTNNLRKNLRAALADVKAKMLTNKGNMKEAFRFTIPVEIDQRQMVTKLMRSFNNVQKSLENKLVNGKNGQYVRKGGLNLNVRLNFQRAQAARDLKAVLDSLKAELTVRVKSVVDAQLRDVRLPNRHGGAGANRSSAGFFGAGAGAGLMSSGLGSAFAGGGIAYGLFRANEAYGQFNANALAMNAVMGNKEDSQAQQKWLKDFSNDLGIVYQDALPSYTKMLASGMTAGMTAESVSGIFEGVASYGQVMGLDSEALKGTYRAIEQMMNKGQIYSEELKGQLAERAPGVISAMAVAAGLDPKKDKDATQKLFKMMEEGKLRSKELLPAFAEELKNRANEGGALDEAKKSTRAGKARAITAFHDGLMLMNKEGGFDKAMGDFYTHLAEMMQRNPDFFIKLGKAATVVVQVLRSGMYVFERIWQAFRKWDESINGKGSLGVLGGIALLILKFSPLGRAIGLVTAAVLVLEEAFAFFNDEESSFEDWFSPQTQGMLKDWGHRIGATFGTLKDTAKSLWGSLGNIYTALKNIGAIDLAKNLAGFWLDTLVTRFGQFAEILKFIADQLGIMTKKAVDATQHNITVASELPAVTDSKGNVIFGGTDTRVASTDMESEAILDRLASASAKLESAASVQKPYYMGIYKQAAADAARLFKEGKIVPLNDMTDSVDEFGNAIRVPFVPRTASAKDAYDKTKGALITSIPDQPVISVQVAKVDVNANDPKEFGEAMAAIAAQVAPNAKPTSK